MSAEGLLRIVRGDQALLVESPRTGGIVNGKLEVNHT
jgi:hypothetical protein